MMAAPIGTGAVVYQARGGIDAIDAYSRHLVEALGSIGLDARYHSGGLPPSLEPEPSFILLQYNPFAFGRSGFAPRLVRDAVRLQRHTRAPLLVMVHEAWIEMTDARSTLIGLWQRAQLRALLRLADGVMTSTEALARELGRGAVHVPVPANVTPTSSSPKAARQELGLNGKLTVALFGRANPGRALDHAEAAIAALAEAHGPSRLTVLNLGADAPMVPVPDGVALHSPGPLAAQKLSQHLIASNLVLLPFTDGASTRRGTLMAALAHGRPVLSTSGRNTDEVLASSPQALVLSPAGDAAAFAREAVQLTADRDRLRALGEAGRTLYESQFDWPAAARRVASALRVAARPRDRVIFVAHDVGGSGGMERHSEQLLERLLAAERSVTVVARTCTLEGRDGLRFVRVRTPRRPFSLAYPAFFAVASPLVLRTRGGIVHTTGAIVVNRADVSTVHYCHDAAAAQVQSSRASRPGSLYRINVAVGGFLSRTAESWCYQPRRARLLCAVSGGVASELRERFPAMTNSIRTIPNGVDAARFRPDPEARQAVRAELGLDDQDPLALFVGGDWERKGLGHAVDALALAPQWRLAVAGAGDPGPHVERAGRAGITDGLRFLGRVEDMPRLYAAADAFVLPTAYEAFPLVALEAAAAGLPLLVTRVNGVEDLLRDGLNGWFIARDGRDIARRLNELCSRPKLAPRMGGRAREAALGFSWEAMADGYLSIYDELGASA